MRNSGLDEAQAGIKIAGRNTNNLRHEDNTTPMKVKSEREVTQWCPTLCTLSTIRVVSSEYLRLLIFLPAILIPVCASFSPEFLMMYSA